MSPDSRDPDQRGVVVKTAPHAANSLVRHASTVAFGPRAGVAITGPAGSGKSTLALALIALGARLVADDRTLTWRGDGALYARAPASIAGLLERRGMGLLRLPPLRLARLCLIVDLASPPARRLPEAEALDWQGITLSCLRAPKPGDALFATFPAAVRHYMQSVRECGDIGSAMRAR